MAVWTTPPTYTPTFIPVATANAQWRDNLNFLFQGPHAVVYDADGQVIGDSTPTNLLFEQEIYDADGFHVAGNPDRLTIPTGLTGNYYIWASVAWPSNATGFREIYVTLNGNIHARHTEAAIATEHYMNVSMAFPLSAGDIVRIGVQQNSGGSLVIPGSTGSDGKFEAGVFKI
jgi:hypothetical protein